MERTLKVASEGFMFFAFKMNVVFWNRGAGGFRCSDDPENI